MTEVRVRLGRLSSCCVARSLYWLKRIGTARSGVVILYRARLTGPTATGETGVTIREVGEANVNDAGTMESSAMVSQFRAFLRKGDRGFYAYVDGRVMHRSWCVLGPGRTPTWFEHGWITLGGRQAYVHYCETAEDARGRGLYPAVLLYAMKALAQSGYEEMFAATDAENKPSRRGLEKAGFQVDGSIAIRVIAGVAVTRRHRRQ